MLDFINSKDLKAMKALKNIPMQFSRLVVLLILLAVFSPLNLSAQIEKWDSLMNLAKTCFQLKDYSKSNEYYQQVIDLIKPFDKDGKLIDKIRGTMAINYIYMGVPFLKENKYSEAKPFFEKALEYSERDPKVFPVANSWMGNWYSAKALEIRAYENNLKQSVDYSIMAEKFYESANAPDKRLKEQISRAVVLSTIARVDEAKQLLKQVISECEGNEKRNSLLAKALNELGFIELNSENYQSAIMNLEQSYTLSVDSGDIQNAEIVARRLQWLYENKIPDNSKVELWKGRADNIK